MHNSKPFLLIKTESKMESHLLFEPTYIWYPHPYVVRHASLLQ